MTAQMPDSIEYEGHKMGLSCDVPLPKKHPRIRYVERGERDNFLTDSSGCWRGYIASWRIKNDQLFLTGIDGRFELLGDEPLPAVWVSGKIRLTAGESVEYVHMGYSSTFEHEWVLKIKKGVVVKVLKETENILREDDGVK